ncbi:MAG: response regulator, partial [Desulfovibrionales bacterium]
MSTCINRQKERSKPGLVPATLFFTFAALVLMAVIVFYVWSSLTNISDIAIDTRDHLLPRVIERQRTAINLERLGRFGMIVYTTPDPQVRRETRLSAQILAQDADFESSTKVHETVWNYYVAVRNIAEVRDDQDLMRDRVWEFVTRGEDLSRLADKANDLSRNAGMGIHSRIMDITKLIQDCRLLLSAIPAITSSEELHIVEQEFINLRREISRRISRFSDSDLFPLLSPIPPLLSRLETVFLYQDEIIRAEHSASVLWRESRLALEEVADRISMDAAVRASERFAAIVMDAEHSKNVTIFGLFLAALVVVTFSYFARRHVLKPILTATRGLDSISHKRRSVTLPPARLRELDAIQSAVERFGLTLAQLEERTEELRAMNAALEGEILERRRTEKDLAKAKEAAETADRSKSRFLASMSHEIRTPLNSIQGMADLLLETPLTKEQKNYVAIFKSSGEDLLNIINDILDISKIEANQLGLEHIDFDLCETVDSVTRILALPAHKQHIELVCRIKPGTPAMLKGDPVRLRQILLNLLGNAVKFTESGEIVLGIEQQTIENDRVWLRFTVRDTGIGIPRDLQGKVFDVFTQSDSSTTRKYGGTGLGLAICKRMVELMGGDITLDSEPGRGSVFTFTARFETGRNARQLWSPFLQGKRILIADDHPATRKTLAEYARAFGAETTLAGSLSESLATAWDERGNPADILVLDARMKDGSGYELAKRLNGNGSKTQQRVIILAEMDLLSSPSHALIQPVHATLTKPVTPADFRKALTKPIEQPGNLIPSHAAIPAKPSEASDPVKILLVEDSENNRMLITWFLRSPAYRVDVAENGVEAVEMYTATEYDVILMDIQMPLMDGLQATREIRKLETERGSPPTPIIALTASAFQDDEHKCRQAGCTAYLPKPVKKEDL